MSLTIFFFGQLSDITGSANIQIDDIYDTNKLITKVSEMFPAIKYKKYAIAVDKKIVTENTPLTAKSVVALMPPFSGG